MIRVDCLNGIIYQVHLPLYVIIFVPREYFKILALKITIKACQGYIHKQTFVKEVLTF